MKKVLLSSLAVITFIFTGCTEEKKVESTPTTTEQKVVQNEVKNDETKETNTQIVSQAANDVANTVKEATNKVVENLKNDETIAQAKEKIVETTKEVVNETMKTAQKVVDETVKTVAPAVAKAIENVTTSTPAVDGKQLFASCASCHGANAEKKALNMSQIIAGWDKQRIIDALNGYKAGTYGGPMKGVMLGQVNNKTPEEIEALATFISGL